MNFEEFEPPSQFFSDQVTKVKIGGKLNIYGSKYCLRYDFNTKNLIACQDFCSLQGEVSSPPPPYKNSDARPIITISQIKDDYIHRNISLKQTNLFIYLFIYPSVAGKDNRLRHGYDPCHVLDYRPMKTADKASRWRTP